MNSSSNAFLVFGANTDVGKTCVSAALAFAAKKAAVGFHYVKPLQTGVTNLQDGDAAMVRSCAASDATIETLYSWPKAVSPHLASHGEVDSKTVFARVEEFLNNVTEKKLALTLIETAGGPASPSSDGILQAYVYRNLNLPVILVGDPKLGGISTTITAYQFLKACGYDVQAVLMLHSDLRNDQVIKQAVSNCQTCVLPSFNENEPLQTWAARAHESLANVFENLCSSTSNKALAAEGMLASAKEKIWWPFTQHNNVTEARFIDAAFGDEFHTVQTKQFDAISSWWTMGLPHGDIGLSQAMAVAASRYGHVLFPEHVHQPAIALAEKLLSTAGKNWAHKVFYSDNGSTAVEVALKMAFRYRETTTNRKSDWQVVGLSDSYHGDTLGAMDASSPNAFKQSESWYKPRGFWLDAPTISYREGVLVVDKFPQTTFQKLEDTFVVSRRESSLRNVYWQDIDKKLSDMVENLGALLIEPVVHGSGGMLFIDPLYQSALIEWCRDKKIPVIFDEVFVGLWRLGVPSTQTLLNQKPDIACYAKLLTGGVLPLAATLATNEIFQCFLGDSKAQALLHGHSFTAHPIGCAAGVYAMAQYEQHLSHNRVNDYWDEAAVAQFSKLPCVARATAIGTVFAVEFKTRNNDGYLSNAMASFVSFARERGFSFRPLGNVIYFVVSPFKSKQDCAVLLNSLQSMAVEFFK